MEALHDEEELDDLSVLPPKLTRIGTCTLSDASKMCLLPKSLRELSFEEKEAATMTDLLPNLNTLFWEASDRPLTRNELSLFPKSLTYLEAPLAPFKKFEGLRYLPLISLFTDSTDTVSPESPISGSELKFLPPTLVRLYMPVTARMVRSLGDCISHLNTPRLSSLYIYAQSEGTSLFSVSPSSIKENLPQYLTYLSIVHRRQLERRRHDEPSQRLPSAHY